MTPDVTLNEKKGPCNILITLLLYHKDFFLKEKTLKLQVIITLHGNIFLHKRKL